jgi:hypothetical protein
MIMKLSQLGDSMNTIRRNTELLIDATKEVGLEVSTEKSRCMMLSRHQNAGQNNNTRDIRKVTSR